MPIQRDMIALLDKAAEILAKEGKATELEQGWARGISDFFSDKKFSNHYRGNFLAGYKQAWLDATGRLPDNEGRTYADTPIRKQLSWNHKSINKRDKKGYQAP